MGAFAAHGQAGPFQMAHGDLQDRFLRTMIDGQRAINAGDFNIAHDAKTGHIQKLLVFFLLCVAQKVGVVPFCQRCIVGLCGGPDFVILILVQICDFFGIRGNGAGLVEGVPVIADGRIQQQGQSREKHQDQQQRCEISFFLLHAGFSLPLWAGEGVPPRRSQRDVSAFQICIRELALGAHALLGDQQHSRAEDQNRAEDIEDGGADAAGGGKLCAGVVYHIGGQGAVIYGRSKGCGT